MNRDRVARRGAILAALLVVVLVCGLVAAGFSGGLFAIAIGAATAVAVFSDKQSTCSPSFLRRRR